MIFDGFPTTVKIAFFRVSYRDMFISHSCVIWKIHDGFETIAGKHHPIKLPQPGQPPGAGTAEIPEPPRIETA
jgi:hypothetical protein